MLGNWLLIQLSSGHIKTYNTSMKLVPKKIASVHEKNKIHLRIDKGRTNGNAISC